MNNCCRCFPDDQEFHLCPPCEQILQNRLTVVLDEEFPQDEGYDSEWLAKLLPKNFECSLCFGAFREPVQIRECGHVFCTGCLERATREEKMCPIHRGVPFTQTFPDQAKRRDVLSLNVACKNEGCTWQGELSDLLNHLRRRCLKIRFACLNEGCEEVLCRENLFAHINDECQFRLIACEFCALSITFLQIKEHHSVNCQRIPTSCEFVSGRRFPRNEVCLMAGSEIQINKAELVEVKANNSEYKFENVKGLKIPSKYVVSIRNSKGVKSDKFEYDKCELYTTEVNQLLKT